MLELMVVAAIFAVLSVGFVANFRRGEKVQSVKLAADDAQSALRQMQNNILSGAQYSEGVPAGNFGFEILDSGLSYNTFVEDTTFPVANKKILESVNFSSDSDIEANNLLVGGQSASKIEFRFYPPFAKVRITGLGTDYTNEENIAATFDLELTGGSFSSSKTIEVDGLTGRIEAR